MREYTTMPTQNDDLNDDKKENHEDDLADNNKEHHETSIKCKLCEFEAASKSLMIEHIMSNIMSHVSSNWTNKCRILHVSIKFIKLIKEWYLEILNAR